MPDTLALSPAVGSSSPRATAASLPQRFPELDALRGIAAVTVVLHHFFHYLEPAWYESFWSQLLFKHSVCGGREAVMLFFLLSGFVLALPLLKGKYAGYGHFALRRVIRIYLPYLGALALSVGGDLLFNGHRGINSYVENTWSQPVTWALVNAHILFIGNYDWAQINTAFWSLVYEMRISLLFPALFYAAVRLRARWVLLLAVGIALGGQSYEAHHLQSASTIATLGYIAIFLAGITLAKNLDRIGTRFARLSGTGRGLLLAASVMLYTQAHLLADYNVMLLWRTSDWLVVVGAAGFITFSLFSPTAQHVLRTPVAHYLGRISYSLYLVHGTVLFSVMLLLRRGEPAPALFVLYLLLSFGASTLFCRYLEEPCIALSRRAGRWGKPALARGQEVRQPGETLTMREG